MKMERVADGFRVQIMWGRNSLFIFNAQTEAEAKAWLSAFGLMGARP